MEGVPGWIDAKIVSDYEAKAKARAAKDSTAISMAYRKAKDRAA